MDGRVRGSRYIVTTDNGHTQQWVRSIRKVTTFFNQAGHTISESTVYALQVQRDDRNAGRPNTRTIAPLPSWVGFSTVEIGIQYYSQNSVLLL
eukprot:COSAG02_NODE_869_length_16359_cov_49.339176_1_plen_93_part_00